MEPIDPTENTTDGKPYSVLYYGNGPGYVEPRADLTNVDMSRSKRLSLTTGKVTSDFKQQPEFLYKL